MTDIDALIAKLNDPAYDADVLHRKAAADALRAQQEEIARLRKVVQTDGAELDRLCAGWKQAEAERDALRQDAERYRWLRDETNPPSGPFAWSGNDDYNAKWDAAIDAAIAAEKKPC